MQQVLPQYPHGLPPSPGISCRPGILGLSNRNPFLLLPRPQPMNLDPLLLPASQSNQLFRKLYPACCRHPEIPRVPTSQH